MSIYYCKHGNMIPQLAESWYYCPSCKDEQENMKFSVDNKTTLVDTPTISNETIIKEK